MFAPLRQPHRGATLTDYMLVVALIVIVVIGTLTTLGGNVADPFAAADGALDGSSSGGGSGPSSEPTPEPTPEPTIAGLIDSTSGGQGQGFDSRTYRISAMFVPAGGSVVSWTFDTPTQPYTGNGGSQTGLRCGSSSENDDVAPTTNSSHSVTAPEGNPLCYIYLWNDYGWSAFTGGIGGWPAWDADASAMSYTPVPMPEPAPSTFGELLGWSEGAQGMGFDNRTTRISDYFDPADETPVSWTFHTTSTPDAGYATTGINCDGVNHADVLTPTANSSHWVVAPAGATSCYVFLRDERGYSYVPMNDIDSTFGYTADD